MKPAAQHTRSRVVLVLATPATLHGELFTTTAERHAPGVEVVGEPCPGLVAQIEQGRERAPETVAMLRGFLDRGLAAGADHIVLACTHYPFVIESIRQIAGPGVQVLDPAPAVARQLGRVLADRGLVASHSPEAPAHRFYTTAPDAEGFARALDTLVGVQEPVARLSWVDGERLVAVAPG